MSKTKNKWLNLSKNWRDRRKTLKLKLKKTRMKLNNKLILKRKRRINLLMKLEREKKLKRSPRPSSKNLLIGLKRWRRKWLLDPKP